jgi:hypothetical protein
MTTPLDKKLSAPSNVQSPDVLAGSQGLAQL